MKILVCDDEPNIRRLIQSRLEANGYTVSLACDGEECMQMIAREKPDLMLLDVMMPKMDGFSVLVALKELREMDESVGDFPVIVLTARADDRVKELLENEHIASYLIKPFDSRQLLETIGSLLPKQGQP